MLIFQFAMWVINTFRVNQHVIPGPAAISRDPMADSPDVVTVGWHHLLGLLGYVISIIFWILKCGSNHMIDIKWPNDRYTTITGYYIIWCCSNHLPVGSSGPFYIYHCISFYIIVVADSPCFSGATNMDDWDQVLERSERSERSATKSCFMNDVPIQFNGACDFPASPRWISGLYRWGF